MEDECSIGNDETRIFILSSYASNKMNRVPCVLCKTMLHIFDRYPLLDGTLFLSPKQHNKSCIQVSSQFWELIGVFIHLHNQKTGNILLFNFLGKIRGKDEFLDGCLHVLSRRMDRRRHCLPILFQTVGRKSSNSWYNVLV